jgi:hypothetical protein
MPQLQADDRRRLQGVMRQGEGASPPRCSLPCGNSALEFFLDMTCRGCVPTLGVAFQHTVYISAPEIKKRDTG